MLAGLLTDKVEQVRKVEPQPHLPEGHALVNRLVYQQGRRPFIFDAVQPHGYGDSG